MSNLTCQELKLFFMNACGYAFIPEFLSYICYQFLCLFQIHNYMMEILHPAIAFSVLKPACNDVIKQPLKNHILKLTELLRTVSPSALQVLHELTLYPLELHLQNLQLR